MATIVQPKSRIKLGATYSSYEDLQEDIQIYSQLNYVQLVVGNSKTVGVANKSVAEGKPKYPSHFKYSNITYVCKHYGAVRTTGTGLRPNQKSYKLKCPMKLTVACNPAKTAMVIKHIEESHSHEITEEIFRSYPEQRQVSAAEGRQAKQMLASGIPSAKISSYLSTLSGKLITAKDIQNMKRTGQSEEQRLLQVMSDILHEDSGALFQINTDNDAYVESVYMQTSLMKDMFKSYPEVLIMDTTYKVNNKNMHLTSLMVLDGEGHGQIVAHGLLSQETKDFMTKFLEWFVQNNSVTATKTECMLVDKDFAEIGAIETAMPGVAIHLCLWHVLCALKRRLQKEKLGESRQNEIYKILQNIVYSSSPDLYERNKEKLKSEASDIPTFLKYFEENWNNCHERWVTFKRREILNFGTQTTTFLESFHQKIKKYLSLSTALDSCIKHLILHNNESNTTLNMQNLHY